MIVTKNESEAPIFAWTEGVEFEDSARRQVENIAKMPFIHHHVAIMPDVHFGIGATIGSVIATKGAIVPASVGVDLGCGMQAYNLGFHANLLPDDLGPLRAAIEKSVPHGRTNNGQKGDRGAWANSPYEEYLSSMQIGLENIVSKSPGLVNKGGIERALYQMTAHCGTLGTGNHFIELCLDENLMVWAMLHSGSRGIGNRIGSYFIEQAKEQADKYFYAHTLPDKDLAYLVQGTPIYDRYIEAVYWAQEYARTNRDFMMNATIRAVQSVGLPAKVTEEAIQCHHNYVSFEHHYGDNVIVTRKGAVRAGEGDMGIIPGSMGAKSFIVRGKGSRESFESCSHGAGRRMGRNEAKRQITQEAFDTAMAGIESRHDKDVIDEAPQAYKSIDSVMAAQADLVDVVHTLRQVLVVKG